MIADTITRPKLIYWVTMVSAVTLFFIFTTSSKGDVCEQMPSTSESSIYEFSSWDSCFVSILSSHSVDENLRLKALFSRVLRGGRDRDAAINRYKDIAKNLSVNDYCAALAAAYELALVESTSPTGYLTLKENSPIGLEIIENLWRCKNLYFQFVADRFVSQVLFNDTNAKGISAGSVVAKLRLLADGRKSGVASATRAIALISLFEPEPNMSEISDQLGTAFSQGSTNALADLLILGEMGFRSAQSVLTQTSEELGKIRFSEICSSIYEDRSCLPKSSISDPYGLELFDRFVEERSKTPTLYDWQVRKPSPLPQY